MAPRLLVLIPPSQAKARGGRATTRAGVFDDALDEPRRQVRAALAGLLSRHDPRELARVLGASGPLLERATAATAALEGDAPRLAAWRRYQGVVWTHLDPASLPVAQRRRLLVPSALYGLVSAQDPIADYRLTMDVAVAPLPVLSRFWRSTVSSLLATHARGATVVNLLPREHAASVDVAILKRSARVIHAHFVAHDGRRAVGHDAKAVKGALARRLVGEGIDAVASSTWRGWEVRLDGDNLVVRAPLRRRGAEDRESDVA